MTKWEAIFYIAIGISILRGIFARIRKAKAMNYQAYLKTPHWKHTRKKIIARDKSCVLCGSTEHLVVHHRRYDNIGNEHDDDLVTLCTTCHNWYTAYSKKHKMD